MAQEAAAPELLNDIVCDCSADSCIANCSCYKHNQPGTTSYSWESFLHDSEIFWLNYLTKEAYDFLDHQEDTD